MPSTFTAHRAEAYEQVMGRWSRRLAPVFIDFAGLADGDRILEAGCGTGSLTLALAERATVAAITAIDYAEVYVEFARRRNRDPRITIEQGDVCALRFGDGAFDRSLSMLVLQFVPESERAVSELRRVTRRGGVVAAAVWDAGGASPQRLLLDTAAVLDPAALALRARHMTAPMTRPGEMAALWRKLGLVDVEQTTLTIRFDYASFEDYWQPYLTGEGPFGSYVADLSDEARARLEHWLRLAYEAGAPDGPRSLVAAAWACRGRVP
jgi:SAM-dependent methyltransferase